MEIPSNIKSIIDKLYSNKLAGLEELQKVDFWLNQIQYDEEVERWFKNNWVHAGEQENNLSFDDIKLKIKFQSEKLKKQKIRDRLYQLQKVAAILIIPLLMVTSWLALKDNQGSSQWLALTTKQGERTHIVLPDGSEVWINVDTKLEYPTSFNQKNRFLRLQGEAYFKVAKGHKLPFMVSAKDFKVQAIGTEFNISAYNDDEKATTFLKEGVVKFIYSPEKKSERVFEMKPGEQAIINSSEYLIQLMSLSSKKSGNWRNGELYFENESMDAVFRKIERWYNIKIHYNKDDFTGETLVLNLENGESVDRLLMIIDNAIGLNFNKSGNEYWIARRNKN